MRMRSKTTLALAVLVIFSVTCLPVQPQLFSNTLGAPSIRFFGSGKSLLRIILRDMESATKGVDVSLYVVGGVPELLKYRVGDNLVYANLDITFNSIAFPSNSTRFFDIEVGGFYVKAYFSMSRGIDLSIYTTALYSTKSFYISICPKTLINESIIALRFRLSLEPLAMYVDSYGVAANLSNVPFTMYLVSGNLIERSINGSLISLVIRLYPNQCANMVIGFSDSTNYIVENIAKIIDYTKKVFEFTLSKYPIISSPHYYVESLYLLSIYNTLNSLLNGCPDDDVLGVYPEELSSYIYLSRLSDIDIGMECLLQKLSKDLEVFLSITSYILYYPENVNNFSLSFLKKLVKDLSTLTLSYNRTSDLAKVYWASETLYKVLIYSGVDFDIVDEVNKVRRLVLSKIESLCTGSRCRLSMSETLVTSNNALEAVSIALYRIPGADKHIDYVVKVIADLGLPSVQLNRRYIVDSIEALAMYGYEEFADRLVSRYYNSVLYEGVPCIDFYRAVLRGFLGVEPSSDTFSVSPRIPMALTNTLLKAFLCDKYIEVLYANWGDEIASIYIDSMYYVGETIVCRDLGNYSRVTIVLREKPLTPIHIEVKVNGVPAKGVYVELYTFNGFSSAGFTDNNGVTVLAAPCSERWVFIKINNTVISMDITNLSCKGVKLSINIPFRYSAQERDTLIDYILNKLNEVTANLSRTKDYLNTLENDLYRNLKEMKQSISLARENINNISKEVSGLSQERSYLWHTLYTLLGVSILSLALSLLAIGRRK